MMTGTPDCVTMVPIERILVLNSRERDMKVFDEIVDNIRAIGLKKPITVAESRAFCSTSRRAIRSKSCSKSSLRINRFSLASEEHSRSNS